MGAGHGQEANNETKKTTYSIAGDILSVTDEGENEKIKISNRKQNEFLGTPIGAPFILEFKRKIN